MIIRCRKCETKFRFEDSLITGDGVWVRCSRCRNVFFHDNPAQAEKAPAQLKAAPPFSTQGGQEKDEPERRKATPDKGGVGDTPRDREGDPVLSRIEEIREAIKEKGKDPDLIFKEFDALEHEADEHSDEGLFGEMPDPGKEDKKRGSLGKYFAYFFLVLLMSIMLGALYLWIFPQARQQAVEFLAPYFPTITLLGNNGANQNQAAGLVTIQDARQHFVNNWLMGNLRVVEGAAVNAVKYPLTRIRVRSRLYDEKGAISGESISFCGNFLTDAELATLTEDEIQRKLSQPLGSNVPNDRISPHGQIPFMIVFSHEPPTVAKVTVMAAGAEKLLE